MWINKTGAMLAPMAGVTDAAFRRMAQEQGALLTFGEMVSAQGLLHNGRKTRALVHIEPEEGKVGIQLFGKDPAAVAHAIRLLEEKQGGRIACFDLNMGCPVPKIVRNGEGAALMKDPALAERIVRAAKEASSLPVTVKYRKGFDSRTANYVEFARMLEDAGADAITLHGRLREEFYGGKADWDAIAAVKRAVCIPVVANGDVFSPEDAVAILEKTGADGVMVARGALGNPFIFGQIAAYLAKGCYTLPGPVQKAAAMRRHAELCRSVKGERLAMIQFRKHAAWYLKGVPGAAALRKAALSLNRMRDLEDFVEQALVLMQGTP